MRTLKAGSLSRMSAVKAAKSSARCADLNRIDAFTFIEICVVLAIMSVVMLIVLPRLSLFDAMSLDFEARRAAALFRYLDAAASAKKKYYMVRFHSAQKVLEVSSSANGVDFTRTPGDIPGGFALSSGTKLLAVTIEGFGKIDSADAAVVFNPGAGAEAFTLALGKNGRIVIISYNPYSGRVKIMEG